MQRIIYSMNYIKENVLNTNPSMTRLSYKAGLSQTGQFQVGFLSFICKNRYASKHWRC